MEDESRQVDNLMLMGWIEQELRMGHTAVLRVRGGSMYPFLRDNRDLVTLRAFAVEGDAVGKIVLFRYEDRYLLHRVIKKESTNYYLRGDNNWSFHLETCREEDIRGIVVKVKRNGYEIDCDSWRWRFLSWLWVKTHCWRVNMYRFYRYFRKLDYKIK